MMKTTFSCILCTAIAASMLLGAMPASAAVPPLGAGDGVHPHDLPGRSVQRGEERYKRRTRAELYEYYYNSPHRSKTHALHPFNRYRYWDHGSTVFETDMRFGQEMTVRAYIYDAHTGRLVRASTSRNLEIRKGVCSNYVRVRPNQWTPSFGYHCIDGDAVMEAG